MQAMPGEESDFWSISMITKFKQCGKCRQMILRTEEYFNKHKTTRDGYTGMCKDCMAKERRAKK